MLTPNVSVVIPTYNRAYLIQETINSVLQQTFEDFELIVVDDGSTDNTEEVVKAIADSRLNYIKQANQGAPVARNTGIKAATGEFVAFLDSDDLFLPERLSLQMKYISKNTDVDFICGEYSQPDQSIQRTKKSATVSVLELEDLLLGAKVHLSTVTVRRTCLEKIGGFDEQCTVSQEWDLYLQLGLSGCKMVHLAYPFAAIRQEPGSLGKMSHNYESIYFYILDKAFDDPRIPASIQTLRDAAYGRRFVLLAASAYLAKQPQQGKEFLDRALATDPTLTNQNLDRLVDKLVNHISGLSLDQAEAEEVLRLTTSALPGSWLFTQKLKYRLWGKYYLQQAFLAYKQNQQARCRKYAILASLYSPHYLRNKGLVSILAQSMTGNLFSKFRFRRNNTVNLF